MFYKIMYAVGLASSITILTYAELKSVEANSHLSGQHLLQEADATTSKPGVSPIRRINRGQHHKSNHSAQGVRSIDGSDNNLQNNSYGEAHTQLARLVPSDYGDGISTLAGADRPSARAISNAVTSQTGDILNPAGASDFLWQWGQFLDHDLDLTDGADPAEPANISIPRGDAHFDPLNTGTQEMDLNRSLYDTASGTSTNNPRQQVNEITAWIDASNVYGSDETRANALRTLDGTGQLKTSEGNLLPFNADGLPNAGGTSAALFLAGDVRANEQLGLTSMHTLFVREHNRIAAEYAAANPEKSGGDIYEHARKLVGAMMQTITYYEYLPILMGENALNDYRGYRNNIDASISNMFSTVSYRYGHSALSPQLLRFDANGDEVTEGHLPLRNAFFSPQRLGTEGGIEPILRGLASQQHQDIDAFIIDDVRNFLFGEPGSGGFDLVSLNIQRGRDHGIPSYNDARAALGLNRATSFADISSSVDIQARLATAYSSVDDIDAWVGGLAEDHVSGALIGELNFTVLKQQFEALRDGDRFWYENYLSRSEQDFVKASTLAEIIRRNTSIDTEIQDNVFIAASTKSVIAAATGTSTTAAAGSGGGGAHSILYLLALLGSLLLTQIHLSRQPNS